MSFLRKTYSEDNDEELMENIRHGNAAAFDELYRRYSQRMLLYFYRMLGGDAEKAQDFLQDLFVKVIEKKDLFREGARFYSWIFTVAHNMCKNEYRRLSVRKIVDREADPNSLLSSANGEDSGIDGRIDGELFRQFLIKELGRLDENQRSAFILRFQEQLSIKEISQILDCSEGTTKSRLFYAAQKLSKKLKWFDVENNEVAKHERE